MQIYDCQVRHAGNMLHTIPKKDVTDPEIMILKHLHGGDAVVDIKPRKNDRRAHREEIDRLKRIYGLKAFHAVFGEGYIEKLPQKLFIKESDTEEPEETETEEA